MSAFAFSSFAPRRNGEWRRKFLSMPIADLELLRSRSRMAAGFVVSDGPTAKHGRSGLRSEAQREAVCLFVAGVTLVVAKTRPS